jgi:hypothetical protein
MVSVQSSKAMGGIWCSDPQGIGAGGTDSIFSSQELVLVGFVS